jgi:hypothetical protein
MLWESQPDQRFGRKVDSLGPGRKRRHLVGHTACQAVVLRASLGRMDYKPSCGALGGAET